MIVISDNSVLSCLSEIGELDLLRRLYGRVTITETIRREAVHPRSHAKITVVFTGKLSSSTRHEIRRG